MLIHRSSFQSSLSQRGIIIVGGKPSQPPAARTNSLNERGIIIVSGKSGKLTAPAPNSLNERGIIIVSGKPNESSPALAAAVLHNVKSAINFR